jgi:hypothetical protein
MSKPKLGDTRDDGFVYVGRHWYSPKAAFRTRVCINLNTTKSKAVSKGIPFDLDTDYILSIYPKDNKCPVLGIELAFGNEDGRNNSPSIDRIIPALGYIKGNVIIVSLKANRIKSNASPEEIIKVGEFYQRLEDSE